MNKITNRKKNTHSKVIHVGIGILMQYKILTTILKNLKRNIDATFYSDNVFSENDSKYCCALIHSHRV